MKIEAVFFSETLITIYERRESNLKLSAPLQGVGNILLRNVNNQLPDYTVSPVRSQNLNLHRRASLKCNAVEMIVLKAQNPVCCLLCGCWKHLNLLKSVVQQWNSIIGRKNLPSLNEGSKSNNISFNTEPLHSSQNP